MTSFLLWYLTEAIFPPSPEWKKTEESKQLILFLKTNVMVMWSYSDVCWAVRVFLCRKRDAYLQKGKALLKDGKKSEAVDCFQKCVDVSPEMALAFIKVNWFSDS